jgi:hypothetical protein
VMLQTLSQWNNLTLIGWQLQKYLTHFLETNTRRRTDQASLLRYASQLKERVGYSKFHRKNYIKQIDDRRRCEVLWIRVIMLSVLQ